MIVPLTAYQAVFSSGVPMPVPEVKTERHDEAEIVALAKQIKEANKAKVNQVKS